MGGVNEMVNVHESPKPHGPDIVAGMLLTFMRAAPGVALQGRAYDLRSAYRQLPVSLRSLRRSFVAHWNSNARRAEIDQLLAEAETPLLRHLPPYSWLWKMLGKCVVGMHASRLPATLQTSRHGSYATR